MQIINNLREQMYRYRVEYLKNDSVYPRLIEEHKEIPEPLTLDKKEVKRLLEKSGVEEEKLTDFEKLYDAAAGEDTALFVDNVASIRTFEVKTPDVVVKVNPERADLVNTMMVDGRKCLVIEINDQVEVNGINVKAFGS